MTRWSARDPRAPDHDLASEVRVKDAPAALIANRYRVKAALGKGGMASVWRVDDEVAGKALALKRLSKAADLRHVALFEREYHTLASLRHPCIVEAYDYSSDANGPFYTMELLDGSDVSKRSPMPWKDVCRILRDLASALALLHARRLIHRDLSARNIWVTPDGRVKLIDFGTMAAFGKAVDVAGTPPFIAPESLRGRELDQRTDLYSLGALAYFLLTGRHAFPARTLAELEALQNERPRPVSKRVAELERTDLPEVPEALEALVDRLLSRDPLGRPTTAADVIDQLSLIAALPPGEQGGVIESYLGSPGFAGRDRERRILREAFARAESGAPANVVVESAPGLGRSRLLAEFALEARLAGAVVLEAQPHADCATHEVAQEYAFRLLDALPGAARAAAAPYANVLGHVSPMLRHRLGLRTAELAPMPQAHGEARMRVQVALRDWFLAVARDHLVVIVADDLERFDDGSAAWLAALSREPGAHRLQVVAALRNDRAPFGIAVQGFRQNATRLELGPLSLAETSELLRSVFGDVQHLARFVDLLHQRAEGNPAHTMDLAEHLSRERVVVFTEGAWVLPQTIDAGDLPANRVDAEAARLGRLLPHARALGQTLSVREGPIPLDMCAMLAELDRRLLFDGLESLVREGVLTDSPDGYRFTRESLRTALHAELDETRLRRAHRTLGEWLLASPALSELDRLKAGVHLLRGGDDERGSRTVAAAGKHYGLVELADLGPAVPALEVALEHFRARGRTPHELVALLAPLALAGYYADRRLATRYGEEAVSTLETVVGLKRARRLRPFLGRKLSLLAALATAALSFAWRSRNPRVPTFREAMLLLFNCVAALTGVCTICIDPWGGRKYAKVLEPMTALGPDHVATFMHRFCLNLVDTLSDRVGQAAAQWTEMIERLDRPNAVRDLPENVHALYLAGALYARGVAECWRDDSRALEYAERLEKLELKLYDMSADQVRMMYHANRGNVVEFDRYRERVEVHAIQRGTAWQVETWTFSGLVTVYARTRDASRLKDCVEQLKRLSAEMPSLRFASQRALAAYLVVRGTPSEALDIVGKGEEPFELVGWTRGQGVLASAYNALGNPERAKEICDRALRDLRPEDLEFCALNLGIRIELFRAVAGLGDVTAAEAGLHALLTTYEPAGNLLTMGALHEALAEIAALRGDVDAVAAHVAEVERWFRQSRDPALVARCERLARLSSTSKQKNDDRAPSSSRPPRLMTIVHRLRHGGDHTPSGSAEWALKQLSELTATREGYLFVARDGEFRCMARIGGVDHEPQVARWVGERVAAFEGEADTETCLADSADDRSRLEIEGRAYRLTVLHAPGGDDDEIVGAVVLPDGATIPHPVLEGVAERLASVVELAHG